VGGGGGKYKIRGGEYVLFSDGIGAFSRQGTDGLLSQKKGQEDEVDVTL